MKMGLFPEEQDLSESDFRRQCLEYADLMLYGLFDEMSDPKYGWVYSTAELERLRDVVCTALVHAMRDGNVLRVHEAAPLDVRGHLSRLAESLPKKPN
jgi:hypothetical protein